MLSPKFSGSILTYGERGRLIKALEKGDTRDGSPNGHPIKTVRGVKVKNLKVSSSSVSGIGVCRVFLDPELGYVDLNGQGEA